MFDPVQKKHIGFIDSFDIMAAALKARSHCCLSLMAYFQICEASGDLAHTEKDAESDEAQARRLQEELMISELSARNLTGAAILRRSLSRLTCQP